MHEQLMHAPVRVGALLKDLNRRLPRVEQADLRRREMGVRTSTINGDAGLR
jgi:hypothetical protein